VPSPVVVLEANATASAPPGTGAFLPARVERGPESLTVDVTAPSAGFVVINEAAYPGWDALVDGRPAAIQRANSLVMAIAVPAGTRRIVLSFRPWPARVLAPIAALVLAILCGWCALGLSRRRSSA